MAEIGIWEEGLIAFYKPTARPLRLLSRAWLAIVLCSRTAGLANVSLTAGGLVRLEQATGKPAKQYAGEAMWLARFQSRRLPDQNVEEWC